MTHVSRSAVLAIALGTLISLVGATPTGAADVARSLSVDGTGVGMYPAFQPSITRYAVTTTSQTQGAMRVLATSSDPSATVRVNGRPVSGSKALSGLSGGDEVSVIFDDGLGREAYSLVYLPAGFPRFVTPVNNRPSNSPKHVLVTPTRWDSTSPNFEAALDEWGVPVHVRRLPSGAALDFKQLADGGYSVFREPTSSPGKLGGTVVRLDERFQQVHAFETKDLVNTDSHDSILRPDGSRVLLAYEPNAATGRVDAVIQEVSADGEVVYTWDSSEHVDPASETTARPDAADYAHINSIEVMSDGDILASFRHFSSVLKIAWSDRGDTRRGDIVWRLGGRHSDFKFVDDPEGSGPCAQHTATELANGHIVIFDNGSATFPSGPSHCVDPDDPLGPTINRARSRVTEYALDEEAGTARLVWSYQRPNWFAIFAGSARRLENGNTLIGWAAEIKAVATEVDPQGEIVWELTSPDGYSTYRASAATVRDAIAPLIEVHKPQGGWRFTQGRQPTLDYACTDRGGSNLRDCVLSGLSVSSTGTRSFTVRATDGAGNTSAESHTYTVTAAPVARADGVVRAGKSRWYGNNVYGGYRKQQASVTLPRRGAVRWGVVRIQNDGTRTDRMSVRGLPGDRRFRVAYYSGRANVTNQVTSGRWTTRLLARGATQDLRVRVMRLRPAGRGATKAVVLKIVPRTSATRWDQVAVVARARR